MANRSIQQTIIKTEDGLIRAFEDLKFPRLFGRLLEKEVPARQAMTVIEIIFKDLLSIHNSRMKKIDTGNNVIYLKRKK